MSEVSWKPALVVVGMVFAVYLAWELRSLILPFTVSALLAYICRPLVTSLERHRIPRNLALALVLTGFLSVCLVIIVAIHAVIPSEHRLVELKVHALYAVNERYKALMGLDDWATSGNRLYRLVRADADAMMNQVHEVLALTPEEHAEFLDSPRSSGGRDGGPDRLLNEHRANIEADRRRGRTVPPDAATGDRGAAAPTHAWSAVVRSPLTALGDALSTWMFAPLVFFFLLRDTGEIKRWLLTLVSNRLFEPALAILSDLDRAVGNYLRGLSFSCSLLGLTITLLFAIIGVPLRWAFAIGFVAAMTNVVPYLGSIVGLLGGLTYAFFLEDYHAVLPIVGRESLPLWVIGAVGVADLMKNLVYDPLVLGGAVRLHPLAVIIGFMAGTILCGVVGAILAIPMITILTVFVSSTARHLKAYGLI